MGEIELNSGIDVRDWMSALHIQIKPLTREEVQMCVEIVLGVQGLLRWELPTRVKEHREKSNKRKKIMRARMKF